jgi:hypothetical protein
MIIKTIVSKNIEPGLTKALLNIVGLMKKKVAITKKY